ncbi:hypothetical protein SAMD00019534_108770 [Acytostelium subglobosum LB1]|uniref:hypothetical protein n=1 Tax=Acytostelium subglobosum LB1 TaxID=1410327 RepID=UPI0006448855|nr:hypothetical protein SAMD00019534_108770 [Acytostelium subglobosum LB1]GAM27701.1 hypothetical protein SAMD00019534_108770 [Acytostelium subglobosum LB1]|eukprot:XP_012749360.1 hypothetical protein SAMD00019534_108770 [Acytostelium subglobosum LB1]
MYTRIKGTVDLFPREKRLYNYVNEVGRRVAALYGFREMSTPIIENTELFQRSVGGDSDIVSKEMYAFVDQGGGNTCLRPENTAGVVRAIARENNLAFPLRYFYTGPMFRYERPQRGRQRQFEQLGVELLGDSDPRSDVDLIDMAGEFLKQLNIANDKYTIKINSLGDSNSRKQYLEQLRAYFNQRRTSLSADSQARLDKGNVLRILDSKSGADRQVSQDAPKLVDHLNQDSMSRFQSVLKGLDRMDIRYELDHNLVRGLDYYSHTIFEVVVNSPDSGVESDKSPPLAILGGGRYDGLANELGYKGKPLPSIGWACGIERILLFMDEGLVPKEPLPIVICTFESSGSPEIEWRAREVAKKLRNEGYYTVVSDLSLSTSKQIRAANQRYMAPIVIVIGEEEAAINSVQVKHMPTETRQTVHLDDLSRHLSGLGGVTSLPQITMY